MDRLQIVDRPTVIVVGIETRSSGRDEVAGNSRIRPLWARFVAERVWTRIPNRTGSGEFLAIYSDQETYGTDDLDNGYARPRADAAPEFQGMPEFPFRYTFTIGCPVSSPDDMPAGMVVRTIPAGRYAIITSSWGAMPGILHRTWVEVSQLSSEQLGGRRAFTTDFEVHDSRVRDPGHAQFDIGIAIE